MRTFIRHLRRISKRITAPNTIHVLTLPQLNRGASHNGSYQWSRVYASRAPLPQAGSHSETPIPTLPVNGDSCHVLNRAKFSQPTLRCPAQGAWRMNFKKLGLLGENAIIATIS